MTKYRKNLSFSLLKKLIINLQGNLSAELGSELYLKCKEVLNTPAMILFDLECLDHIDSIGWEYIKKLKNLASNRGVQFHGCNLHGKWCGEWNRLWEDFYMHHNSRQEAISFIDDMEFSIPKQVGIEENSAQSVEESKTQGIHNLSGSIEENLSLTEDMDRTESGILHFCPHCGELQSSIELGYKRCNSCYGSFILYKHGMVSAYEKLT